MDRRAVYPGAVPLETDVLEPQVFAMVGQGWLLQSMLGTAPVAIGLGCTPTSPASMQLVVGAGALSSQQVVDATPFGDMPASSDALMKLGINRTATTLAALAAPGSTGQSQAFLIEASFAETDADPVVLGYYNASNPAVGFSGPGNSGAAQNIHRFQRVALQVVAGTPAAAGAQATPPVTTGWVPLWIVTLNSGQTSITATSIAPHPQSPAQQFNQTDLAANLLTAAAAYGVSPPADSAGVLQALLARTTFRQGQVVTASQPLIVPALARGARVRLWGAGGPGGPGYSSNSAGSGGGGGAYVEALVTGLTPGATFTAVIAAPPSGGQGNSAGSAALATSVFGIIAGSGAPGQVGNAGLASAAGAGGLPNLNGSLAVTSWTRNGETGGTPVNAGSVFIAGQGGGCHCSGATALTTSNGSVAIAGASGAGPGQGGSGGVAGGGGGNGGPGLLLIDWTA